MLLVSCYIGEKKTRNMKAINLYIPSRVLSTLTLKNFCRRSFLIKYLILHFFSSFQTRKEEHERKIFHKNSLFCSHTPRYAHVDIIMKSSSNINGVRPLETSYVTSSNFLILCFYNLLSFRSCIYSDT